MTQRTVAVRLTMDAADYIRKAQEAGDVGEDAMKRMKRGAKTSDQALQELGATAGKIGLAAGAAFIGVAKKAADFDAAMSSVKAATMESAAGMDRLREAALQAGAETVFSATEAAAGIENLAKAGVSTADILDGGLTGALDLAAAGQLGVADAAEFTATALTQFGLAGDQATHVADLLAAGAGKAMGEVSDMALALNYTGVQAAQMGVSIEETSGTIALLAQNGMVGEKAGTALRGMLASLTSPSVKAAEEMEKLGLSVFDAQGEFIGFEATAGALQQAMEGLTVAEQQNALGRIFGTEQMSAVNLLVKEGAAGVGEWTRKVNDQGFAATQASTKLDNLKGDVEELGGALETALIGTGDGAQGPLRSMTQGVTALVNAYNDLPGPMKTAVGGTAAVVAVGGGAAFAFTKVVSAVTDTREALQTLRGGLGTTSTGLTRTQTALGKVGRAAGAATVALVAMEVASQFAPEATIASLEDIEKAILDVEGAAKGASLDEVFTVSGSSMASVDGLADALETLSWNGAQRTLDWLGGMGGIFDTEYGLAEESVRQFDQTLAGMVSSGNLTGAAAGAREFREAAVAAGLSTEKADGYLSAYSDALTGVDNEARTAGVGVAEFAGASDAAAAASGASAAALQEQAEAFAKTREEALRLANAELNWYATLDDATAALKENGRTVDITTEAGRANRSALYEMAAAWQELDPATREAAGGAKAAKAAFIDTATSMGMGKAEARKLYTELMKIPPAVTTEAKVTGVPEAETALERLARDRTATVHVLTSNQRLGDDVSKAGGRSLKHAEGGTVPGQRAPYGDKVLSWLAPGEEVITNRNGQADKHRGLLKAINAGAYADGGTVGFASGAVRIGGDWMSFDKATKRLEKRFDSLSDKVQKHESTVEDWRRKMEAAGDVVSGQYQPDLFEVPESVWAAGGSDPLSAILGAQGDLRTRIGLQRKLEAKGLSGAAFEAFSQGSNEDLEAVLKAGGVKRLQREYEEYERLSAKAARQAGRIAYGDDKDAAVKELREARKVAAASNRELKDLRSSIERWQKKNPDIGKDVADGLNKTAGRSTATATKRRP